MVGQADDPSLQRADVKGLVVEVAVEKIAAVLGKVDILRGCVEKIPVYDTFLNLLDSLVDADRG